MSGLRDPRADRSNGESEAEKEMGRGREMFGQRIKKYDGKGNWREQKGQAIDCGGREKKNDRTNDEEKNGSRFWQEQMTRRCARIALVKRPVDHPIEKHRGSAGADHTNENEHQNSNC